MRNATRIFDKGQRKILSGIIRGLFPGTVAVARYTTKINEELINEEKQLQHRQLSTIIYRASNNQEVFRAVYNVLEKERPDQLKELFNGQEIGHNAVLETV